MQGKLFCCLCDRVLMAYRCAADVAVQDLHYLSDGLEGRTSNPLALLFDALANPHVDVGAQLPSLLRWEFHPEREIPHVVLGRYDEGGIWQVNEMMVVLQQKLSWPNADITCSCPPDHFTF